MGRHEMHAMVCTNGHAQPRGDYLGWCWRCGSDRLLDCCQARDCKEPIALPLHDTCGQCGRAYPWKRAAELEAVAA